MPLIPNRIIEITIFLTRFPHWTHRNLVQAGVWSALCSGFVSTAFRLELLFAMNNEIGKPSIDFRCSTINAWQNRYLERTIFVHFTWNLFHWLSTLVWSRIIFETRDNPATHTPWQLKTLLFLLLSPDLQIFDNCVLPPPDPLSSLFLPSYIIIPLIVNYASTYGNYSAMYGDIFKQFFYFSLSMQI